MGSLGLICGVLIYNSSTNLQKAEIELAQQKLEIASKMAAKMIANSLNSSLDTIRNQYQWVMNSTSADSKIRTDENSISIILKNILIQNPEVFGIWLEWQKDFFENSAWSYTREQGPKENRRYMTYWTRNAKGEITAGSDSDDSLASADQSYYMIPFQSGKEVAAEPYVYPVDGVNILMTSLTIPMKLNGKTVGVAGVDLDVASLQKLADSQKIFGGAGDVAIVTAGGLVAGWTGRAKEVNTKYRGLSEKEFQGWLEKIEKESDGEGIATVDDKYVHIEKIQIGKVEKSWYAISSVPKSVVMNPLYESMFYQITTSLIFVVCIMFMVMAFINRLSKSLIQTTESLSLLAETNKQVSEKVSEASRVVSEGNNSNSSAVHETVSSLDEISSMVDANSDKAQLSDQSVKETVSQVKASHSDMEEVVNTMQGILEVSDEMILEFEKNTQELQSIVEMIKNIDTKTKVINEIVFQTKLLSFNASVEAARAGEYGKGFSVVAEEVGNLATMSGRSAKEISDILSGSSERITEIIDRSISSIRTRAEKTQVRARSGDELAKKCQESLNGVLNTTEQLQVLIQQIAAASKEQSDGVNNISKAMHMINSTSAANKTASDEAAQCGGELQHNAEKLFVLAEEIKTEVLGAEGFDGQDSKNTGHPKNITQRYVNSFKEAS